MLPQLQFGSVLQADIPGVISVDEMPTFLLADYFVGNV